MTYDIVMKRYTGKITQEKKNQLRKEIDKIISQSFCPSQGIPEIMD